MRGVYKDQIVIHSTENESEKRKMAIDLDFCSIKNRPAVRQDGLKSLRIVTLVGQNNSRTTAIHSRPNNFEVIMPCSWT
jgi:hypothetical protein